MLYNRLLPQLNKFQSRDQFDFRPGVRLEDALLKVETVISRARSYGVKKFLYAAGHLDDAKESLKLCQGSGDFYATIGVHPCRAKEPFKGQGTE